MDTLCDATRAELGGRKMAPSGLRPRRRLVTSQNDMNTDDPSGQESVGEEAKQAARANAFNVGVPSYTIHLVCRDCTHETLHSSMVEARVEKRAHLHNEPDHDVEHARVV